VYGLATRNRRYVDGDLRALRVDGRNTFGETQVDDAQKTVAHIAQVDRLSGDEAPDFVQPRRAADHGDGARLDRDVAEPVAAGHVTLGFDLNRYVLEPDALVDRHKHAHNCR